jgi:hypothetical protein
MLVNLANNVTIGANASQTWQYACDSAQQVFVRVDDNATGSLSGHLTIQIGNDVICNDIDFGALSLINLALGGGRYDTADAFFRVDIGSHILDSNENLYVTLRNDAGDTMVASDVCAIVNEGGVYQPLKYTNYSDSVFTDSNTLSIYAWSGSDLDDDDTAFTIRNQSYSSTPLVQDGVNVTTCSSYNDASSEWAKRIGTMAKNQVPMNTSVNYSSTDVDGVVCISAMDKTPSKARFSKEQGSAILSSMTPAERKAL